MSDWKGRWFFFFLISLNWIKSYMERGGKGVWKWVVEFYDVVYFFFFKDFFFDFLGFLCFMIDLVWWCLILGLLWIRVSRFL